MGIEIMENDMSEDKEFMNKLMKALENSQIIEKIQEILSFESKASVNRKKNIENGVDCEQNGKISEELCFYKKQLDSLELENNKLVKERDCLLNQKQKNELMIQQLKNECKQMQNELAVAKKSLLPYAGLIKVTDAYENLPIKIKNAMKNLLGKGAPEELIACGLRQSYLSNFWEAARMYAMNQEYDIARGLGILFEFLVDVYEKTNSAAEKLNVKIGESFDDKKHIHCEGKNRVKVTEILMKGLVINETVVLKAIVR